MDLRHLQLHLPALGIALLAASGFAAGQAPASVAPKDSASAEQEQLSTTRDNLLKEVDVFGEGAIGSIYVFWDNLDLSIEMKQLMTTRNFAKDEFFMQNIDRESFEQERIMVLFAEQRKQFFSLFPEEAEEDEED